jgi:hypothetical protein
MSSENFPGRAHELRTPEILHRSHDFFSIFLPGAVLTYLLQADLGPMLLPKTYSSLQGTQAGLVFLFASYLLGHFLFLVASLLDEYAYDPIRKATDGEQITRLLSGRRLSPRLLRWLARVCFKTRPDAAVNRVVQIKESYLKRIQAPGAVNAFQWSKAQLALDHPEALATVNRFEADSKFFRSFVPMLLIFLALLVFVELPQYGNKWELALGVTVSARPRVLALPGAALQSHPAGLLVHPDPAGQPRADQTPDSNPTRPIQRRRRPARGANPRRRRRVPEAPPAKRSICW